MKRPMFYLRLTTLALATTLALTACGDDNDGSHHILGNPSKPSTPPTDEVQNVVLGGTLTDAADNPLADATVTTGDMKVTTDADGNYSLSLPSPKAPTTLVVMAKKDGYLTTARELIVTPKQTYDLDISLNMDQVNTAFDSRAGVNRLEVAGAKVSIPANAVVKADGSLYTGTVQINANYYNPDTVEGMRSFAQPFAGQNEDGSNRTDLVTVGVIDVKLTDPATGEALNLKEGTTATLIFPEATTDQDLDSIPLWYYDEEKLIWVKDGVATRQVDGTYQGIVDHFTLWNLDIAIGEYSALIEGCVTGDDKNKLADEFYAKILGRGYINYGGVDEQGKFSVKVPINTPLTLSPSYTRYNFDSISIPALQQDTTYQVNDGQCIDVTKTDSAEIINVGETSELPPAPIQLPTNQPSQGVIGYGFDFDFDYPARGEKVLDNVEMTILTTSADSVIFKETSLYRDWNIAPTREFEYTLTTQGLSATGEFNLIDNRSFEVTRLNSSIINNRLSQSLDNGLVNVLTLKDVSLSGLDIGDVLARDEDQNEKK